MNNSTTKQSTSSNQSQVTPILESGIELPNQNDILKNRNIKNPKSFADGGLIYERDLYHDKYNRVDNDVFNQFIHNFPDAKLVTLYTDDHYPAECYICAGIVVAHITFEYDVEYHTLDDSYFDFDLNYNFLREDGKPLPMRWKEETTLL